MEKLSDGEINDLAHDMEDGGPTTIKPDVDVRDTKARIGRIMRRHIDADRCRLETVLMPGAPYSRTWLKKINADTEA